MKKIIAIGGGDIGRPGYPIETTKIDKEIIKLTGKKNPVLLFIPTASGDSESYFETVKNYFGKKLGCRTEVLYLLKGALTQQEIKNKILSADIIYVGGGDTLKMMQAWKKYGVVVLLRQAYDKGIVLSGLSAGAICWFKYGNSDSRKMKNPNAPLIKVSGLNLVSALLCPHYDFEKDRKSDLKKMMKKTEGIAVAIDNCCAIEIIDETYRIISSKKMANAYKVFWAKGTFHHILIAKEKKFLPLSDLLRK
ncbi:MAG: Type 1 glutamine amidotransferase-like domain-containing protein [bacterium]|nr:Type 1 glutamine amidotransferase-like domain-containing protein [bacterium]